MAKAKSDSNERKEKKEKEKKDKREKKDKKDTEKLPSTKEVQKNVAEQAKFKSDPEPTKVKVTSSKDILAGGGYKAKGKKAVPPKEPSSSSSEESSESSSEGAVLKVPKSNGNAVPDKAKPQAIKSSSSSSSSESEDEKPKAVQVKMAVSAKKSVAHASSASSDSGDSESEAPQNRTTNTAPSIAKVSTHSTSDSSDSSESESEDSESESASTPKTKAVSSVAKVSQTAKVAADSKSESESSDSSGCDATAVHAKSASVAATKATTQKTKKPETSSDSGSSEFDSDDEVDGDVEMLDGTTPTSAKGKRKAEEEVAVALPKKVKIRTPIDGDTKNAGESKTLFVGQLSWNVDNDWLKTEFEEAGEVVSVRVQMDRQSGRSRGFGYVEFATTAAAQKALQTLQGKEIDGRPVKLDLSAQRQANPVARAKQFGDVPSEPSTTLFVGNISWNTTEDMLWEHFAQFGEVSSVRVPTERETGKPKGFAYVEFSDLESSKKGYEGASGAQIDRRYIRLDYSHPRDGGSGGGRGRGRGGDRGGGGRGFGDRGGRGGGRGGERGGRGGRGVRGGGRGAPRGGARTGGIASFEGRKKTFD